MTLTDIEKRLENVKNTKDSFRIIKENKGGLCGVYGRNNNLRKVSICYPSYPNDNRLFDIFLTDQSKKYDYATSLGFAKKIKDSWLEGSPFPSNGKVWSNTKKSFVKRLKW